MELDEKYNEELKENIDAKNSLEGMAFQMKSMLDDEKTNNSLTILHKLECFSHKS